MNKFVQVSIDCYIVCTGETGGMAYRRFESVTSVTHILQEFCLYGGYGSENAYRPQSDKMYKLRIYSNEKRMETTGFYIGGSSL